MADVNDEYQQLMDVSRMMGTPGWGHCVQLLNIQREHNIRNVKTAPLAGDQQKHGWEYYQGVLAGFDAAVYVFDELKNRLSEIMEADKQKEPNHG